MGRPKGRRGELRDLLSGSTGALLFEGDSAIDGAPVMVIATGIVRKGSLNVKLGDMIQLWIIRQDVEPIQSVKDGRDVSVCGDCKFRPQEEQGGCRTCYVNIGMAQKIWEAWTRGYYPDATKPDLWSEFFGNRVLRVGAYGDPVVVSHTLWESVLEPARGWVGYTHAWRYAPARFKKIVMASVDSPAGALQKNRDGFGRLTRRARRSEARSVALANVPIQVRTRADPSGRDRMPGAAADLQSKDQESDPIRSSPEAVAEL